MDRGSTGPETTSPPLLGDFRLLVMLFIVFRVALGVVYQPVVFDLYTDDGQPQAVERGLSAQGDLRYYFAFAQMSDQGDWPYRDYWHEFPPVWSIVFIGLYRLMSIVGSAEYGSWATALGLLMTTCDVGNVILLRRLALRLHGEAIAIALPWMYALFAFPVVISWWTFEPLVLFLLLGALWLLLNDERADRSAATTVFGVLTKYIGVLLLPAIWRFRSGRYALRYTAISIGIPLIVFGAMLAWGGAMAKASLLAQANKSSYQTVWALIDGNYGTGVFPSADAHRDADSAYELTGNAPMIPAVLRLIPFAALGGYVFWQTKRDDAQALVAFFALTVVLFFLWAQGWSPQWVVILTPLILLTYPVRAGVLACLVLGFMSVLEYPGLFTRAADTGGVLTGSLRSLFVLIVLLRTGILLAFAAALIARLTGSEASHDAAV